MKRDLFISIMVLILSFGASIAMAGSNGEGNGVATFIDENGDGFNDLAPDADGDGVPNGLDSDYVRPREGAGQKQQALWNRLMTTQHATYFFWGPPGFSAFAGPGRAFGSEDNFGFGGNGPGYGSGLGPGSGTGTGTGNGSGTGPRGPQGGPPDRGGRR